MTTGLDHPGTQIEYTLDGAAILSVPAGKAALVEAEQLHAEGFTHLVRHWYDVTADRDFAEFRRAD